MSEELCPYPGLRPFEENESIFFKGREKHIKDIIKQLESRNFVMITGASGDGKSSIVYAGVIPNIKAGFIKANYNAWRFGIIKPEDKPLKNLCLAFAEMLQLDYNFVYEELSHGFSSIVDLYEKSELYVNQEGEDWINASLEEKKLKRSKAANLFILIDQFEEFFTNSDNYHNGEPNEEAEIVINLVVETVRLANERGLPIYIVFTMRSDFIGNCPAFRGLPELIGYSHFFIPRLNREEVEKIILEPALLNGDDITDTLVNHLSAAASEGRDQLPIIQHALNRIWNIAHVKNEAMDLIHLAKAGGVDVTELPEEQRKEFITYFNHLPEYQKTFYENPSLQNVINSHADDLMVKTIQKAEQKWKDKWSKEVLTDTFKRVFQTLTKIDAGRSVRHRASIKEMVGTVNIAGMGAKEISFFLHQFRSDGNHLIFPFAHQELELKENDVLDITHEALIRNWNHLRDWTSENQEYQIDFNDLNKQLIRWQESDKNNTFLLSLGPLEQFEKWYEEARINSYWLAKYDESSVAFDEKLQKATLKVNDIEEYLYASRKHIMALRAARRRRARILAIASLFIIFILSGISYWAFDQKNYASAQKNIAEQKRIESEKAQQLAEHAKDDAEKSRLLAETKEKEARLSQTKAEKSAREALEQKSIADAATHFARQQAAKAKAEAERANQEFANANKQKTIAEEAKQKAIESETQTRILSDKAFSQTLAYMATEKYDAKDWSAIFALHALDIHDQVNDDVKDQVIFNGLIQGGYNLVGDNIFDLKTIEHSKSFQPFEQIVLIPDSSNFYSLSMDGSMDYWDMNKEGRVSAEKIWWDFSATMNYLYYDSKTDLLFRQDASGRVTVFKNENGKYKEIKVFKNFKGILKGATYFAASNEYYFISKEGFSYLKNESSGNEWNGEKLDDEILSVIALNEELIISGRSGNIWSWKKSSTPAKIDFTKENKVVTYALTPGDGNSFYAGLSNGKIISFSKKNEEWVVSNEFGNKKYTIKNMFYQSANQTLAVAYSNNAVSVFDFRNEKNKPYYLTFKTRIKALLITPDENLILSMSDYSMKSIPLHTEDLYKLLCAEVLYDLTPEQWKEIFGEEYSFQTIKCK